MMERSKCSYCGKVMRDKGSFNSIFVTPTVYKCDRLWCTFLKKIKLFKIGIRYY